MKVVEFISEWSGRVVSWFCLALVLVIVYEVILRYVFNSPTIWVLDTSRMLLGGIIMLGLAYTHRHHGHIRIDIFYNRLSPRRKAMVDVIFSLVFLLPLLIALLYASWFRMWFAHSVGERFITSYWYCPTVPARTLFLLGWCLFTLQCVVQFIRDSYLLIRSKPYD
jgi:TRAP-type mannitol/chloroaromatic compound transport system permease small subunit